MSLYDWVMRATDNPMAVHKVSSAAQVGARVATDHGYPQLATAAAAGAALFTAVNTVMHAPSAAPVEYAGFTTDGEQPKRRWLR
ncbi:hypothetical protein ATKI12_1996 [Kitasatospora sp. Ki12]